MQVTELQDPSVAAFNSKTHILVFGNINLKRHVQQRGCGGGTSAVTPPIITREKQPQVSALMCSTTRLPVCSAGPWSDTMKESRLIIGQQMRFTALLAKSNTAADRETTQRVPAITPSVWNSNAFLEFTPHTGAINRGKNLYLTSVSLRRHEY